MICNEGYFAEKISEVLIFKAYGQEITTENCTFVNIENSSILLRQVPTNGRNK
jgi:hypothetical protein